MQNQGRKSKKQSAKEKIQKILRQKNKFRAGLGFKNKKKLLNMKKKEINEAKIKEKIISEAKKKDVYSSESRGASPESNNSDYDRLNKFKNAKRKKFSKIPIFN